MRTRIRASRSQARELAMDRSKSLGRRRQRRSHPKVRSTIQRRNLSTPLRQRRFRFTKPTVVCGHGRRVDPDLFGERLWLWRPVDESLRVLAPGEAKGPFAFLQGSVGATVVGIMGVSIAIPACRCSVL